MSATERATIELDDAIAIDPVIIRALQETIDSYSSIIRYVSMNMKIGAKQIIWMIKNIHMIP
ncbi:hypothetical protein L6Q21_05280 [Sandaracinobacter sp. RS1-74]|uniref:hypothetical protein n=1 Tax=Sandaracinobacteroides sayramensis TaxID=2913411 RepID=UPI001EDC2B47|nr:hypothetical protein [Sandaracinobacteroides sayramensis]